VTSRTCPHCAAELRPAARFCDACGQPLACADASDTAAATAPPLPDPIAEGRYQFVRFLGEGSRKRVYVAHDTSLDRDVAVALIKTAGLDETGRIRVRRETQAMARLGDHPHIVTVHDIGEEHGQIYVVSQYMAGGDLASLLHAADHHRLPVDRVVRIGGQICSALAHAHQLGIMHRDLKPGNVWLSADGTAKLGDFGLAVVLDQSRLTQEGVMVGTVTYMPPEQALGRSPDPRSDLYAFGVMLYEMLSGRPPFVGDDAVSVLSQHINTAPVAPSWHNPEIPPALERLILALLAKTPEERPATAAAIAETLAAVDTAASAVATLPLAASLDRLAGGIFVGREAAMQELRSGVDEAFSGRGRLLLLVGEPGIGKTRTAEELATYARLRNAQVLVGRCYEGEGAPAYWPWVQVIRAYVHERDPGTLLAELGSRAADIAQVVSELRERLPDLPTPPVLEPEQARFRLFDSITSFLKHAAQHQPLVLVLDDLHWADKPSLLLLQFLARELRGSRMLVLATYRDVELRRQHPLSQALGELARQHLSQRVLLRGITAEDVARFIELSAGHAPPAALVQAVYRETEGNPFFVSEVVRLLVAEGRLERWSEAGAPNVSIPQSVREVIGRRLDRLSEDCNQLLTVASVIGREFSLTVLEHVVAPQSGPAAHTERLLDLLEEAVAARVVATVPRLLGRYAFSHALIRETLYEELSTTRRVRLHRQIGEVLEQLYATSLEPHLAELAYHFFEAAPGGDVRRAVDYATRAAERATARLAYEEAAGHYDRALQAMELQESTEPTARGAVLLAFGVAQRRAGDFGKARETFLRAADIARALQAAGASHAGTMLANAALGFAEEGVQAGHVDPPAISLLEDACSALGAQDSGLHAHVLCRLANQLYWIDSQRNLTLSQAAVEMAQRVGDPAAMAAALASRRLAMWDPQRVDELLATAGEIVHLAEAAGDRGLQALGHEWRLAGLLQLSDIAAVDRELATHARLAREMRLPVQIWLSTSWLAMRALLDGRFDEAERVARQALEMGQRLRPADAWQSFSVQLLILRAEQGRLAELEPTVQEFVARYPQLPAWRCALAYLWSEMGRAAEASAEFTRLAAHDFADLPRDFLWLVAVTLLADVCAMLGDATHAAVLYDLLVPYAGRNVVLSSGTLCLGSASRFLGVLAATMQRWDDATRHLDDALEMHRRIGARPFLAHTQTDYAAMLWARGRQDGHLDRPRILALLNDGLEIGGTLGMKSLVERATALKLEVQQVAADALTTSIDAVASAVQRQRPDLRRHVAADGTVTLMFSDMEGFTQMTERLGDRAAHRVIQAHHAIVRAQLAAHGGAELELQGDGFLLAFADPLRAVRCAVAIQRAFATYSAAHPEQPIRVRIGLHSGEAITEADRFFGKTVILAARIAAQADGGEILVSSPIKERAANAPDVHVGGGREAALKGLVGHYMLYPVDWTAGAASAA